MEKPSPDPRYQDAPRIADAVLYWTDARFNPGRNALPQSDNRSAETRRFTAVMGARRGTKPIGRHTFLFAHQRVGCPLMSDRFNIFAFSDDPVGNLTPR